MAIVPEYYAASDSERPISLAARVPIFAGRHPLKRPKTFAGDELTLEGASGIILRHLFKVSLQGVAERAA